MEKEEVAKGNSFNIIVIVIIVFIGFAIFLNHNVKNSDTKDSTELNKAQVENVLDNQPDLSPQEKIQQVTEQNKLNFNEISSSDQVRLKEIITGVIQNTIQVTPELKSEFRSIFAKYNVTDSEINDFAVYGPVFSTNYQKLFFIDALQAVSTGYTVKSDERLKLEQEALSRGLMTSERIKINDEEMKLIASNQPVVSGDKEILFTTDAINNALSNIDSIMARFKLLFE